MPLTAKQARFTEEYLVDLNATQAAKRAGYSAKTAGAVGHKLLKKAEIAAALEEAMQQRAERTELTQDWIIERLVANAERCMQAEPVLDREGKKTGEYTFQAAGANRALELLGKHLGMFADIQKHGAVGGGKVTFVMQLTGEDAAADT